MTPQTVLTGTLTLADGTMEQLALYLPVGGIRLLGVSISFMLIVVLFLAASRFQTWAQLLALILAVLYLPFSLTVIVGYYVISAGFIIVIASILHFFAKIGGKIHAS